MNKYIKLIINNSNNNLYTTNQNVPVRRILVVPPVRLLPEDPDIFDTH